jgi:RecA/RadA recombinase
MYIEKEVSVKELRELYHNGEYSIEVYTPDGYQKIGKWFDKGPLDMIRVTTPNHETTCAVNHLIQLYDGSWSLASELDEGVMIKTISGDEPVLAITAEPEQECYDFEIIHPNHRYYGDGIVSHNSGKSYICAGNLVRHAQEQGIYVVLVDSENALDESWLHALGVDTSEEKLLKLNMAMIDDVAKTISEFMKSYRTMPEENKPKVLFVIDSLGMLLTPTDVNQFESGDMKGDMGRKPKALTSLVRNCVNMFGSHNVGLVATNHTYQSQDMFDPDDRISGGQGFIYASSIVVAMKKLKLKEDEDGNKISEVRGIRAACKVMKTRYAKPFESVQIKIPYSTGLNPYSGLLDMFERGNLLTKEGNSLVYTKMNGEVIKKFRKKWEANDEECLDIVMTEYSQRSDRIVEDVLIEEHHEENV